MFARNKNIILLAGLLIVLLALFVVPAFAGEDHGSTESDCSNPTIIVHHNGTSDQWWNFSPNHSQGPFDGPPAFPTDARGTWEGPHDNGGPSQDTYGTFQQGEGHGSWFHREQGTPGYDEIKPNPNYPCEEPTPTDVPTTPTVTDTPTEGTTPTGNPTPSGEPTPTETGTPSETPPVPTGSPTATVTPTKTPVPPAVGMHKPTPEVTHTEFKQHKHSVTIVKHYANGTTSTKNVPLSGVVEEGY